MEICDRCCLEDIEKNFNYSNPCDCQCIIHKNCAKVKVSDEDVEFCAYCTEYLPLKELRQRKAYFEESGEFEVERVIEYDLANNQYLVKWKNYPNAANCNTELAPSFIEAVNEFWQQHDGEFPLQAQEAIASLNMDEKNEECTKMPSVKECEKMEIVQKSEEESEPSPSIREENGGNEEAEMKRENVKFQQNRPKPTKNNEQNIDIEQLGKGIFIPVKLSDVMDKKYIIRRQKYTQATWQRYKAKKGKYRKWLLKEIEKQSSIGMDAKRQMRAANTNMPVPRHHLRAIKQEWDCDLPRIRDIILNFLKRDWSQWSHDEISCKKMVLAEIIDPENPAKKYGGDQGVHESKAFGLFAIDTIKKMNYCLNMLVVFGQLAKPAGNWTI